MYSHFETNPWILAVLWCYLMRCLDWWVMQSYKLNHNILAEFNCTSYLGFYLRIPSSSIILEDVRWPTYTFTSTYLNSGLAVLRTFHSLWIAWLSNYDHVIGWIASFEFKIHWYSLFSPQKSCRHMEGQPILIHSWPWTPQVIAFPASLGVGAVQAMEMGLNVWMVMVREPMSAYAQGQTVLRVVSSTRF